MDAESLRTSRQQVKADGLLVLILSKLIDTSNDGTVNELIHQQRPRIHGVNGKSTGNRGYYFTII